MNLNLYISEEDSSLVQSVDSQATPSKLSQGEVYIYFIYTISFM